MTVSRCALLLLIVATPPQAALGQVVIGGLLGAAEYGPAAATQAIGTAFGDNLSELNQAFVDNNATTLSLLATGNLETNGSRFVTLIDIVADAGGSPTIPTAATGNPSDVNQNLIDGSTFDIGPEFALFVYASDGDFLATLQDLTTGAEVTRVSLNGDPDAGSALGIGGPVGGGQLSVAWTNANTAGVGGSGEGDADPNAATAISGIEFGLDKSLIGGPTGDLRITSVVVGETGFISNQFLAPLPPGFGNLGAGPIDLTAIDGDQSFTPFRETITLSAGNTLRAGSVIADNTQVNLYPGGELESGFPSSSSTAPGAERLDINILGGAIGDFFVARSGSRVRLIDGQIGDAFTADTGSEVEISGGSVGDAFAGAGSRVTITGGEVGDAFTAGAGSDVTIAGGQVGPDFLAEAGSTVRLRGSQFAYETGVVPGLPGGVEVVVEDRGDELTLSGDLEDGGGFSFDLAPFGALAAEDVFDPNATLTVTPTADQGLAGDYNGDTLVSAADYTVYRDRYSRTPALHATFVERFGRSTPPQPAGVSAVPEPLGLPLVLLASAVAACRRARKRS